MRERELDEFESMFRRAIIPTIEVEQIGLDSILLLADFGELTPACGNVAARLAERFGASVSTCFFLHLEDREERDRAQRVLDALPGGGGEIRVGDPIVELPKLIAERRPGAIVAPEPFHLHCDPNERDLLDSLLIATPIPTLLIRSTEVDDIFTNIVAKIPGGRTDLIEQFSIAFALCEKGGRVELLHVLEQARLQELVDLLEITPEIDTEEGAAGLLSAAKSRMDHLLKGAVRVADEAAFDVVADLRVGDPFVILPEVARDCSLLILGSQAAHTEFLESRAYALMKAVPGVHVLAL